MIEYRSAADRAVTREGGRSTWHSFSFGAHYDPGNTGFSGLVAHNDEHLPPGTGYPDHPHADLEIVTWVLSGALRHTSTVGSGVLGAGEVQRLRAGSGVVHSEVADGEEPTRFLQAWVRPDEDGLAPDYLRVDLTPDERWTVVADGDGRGVVPLAARGASLHVAHPHAHATLSLPQASRLHVFVASGAVLLGERVLGAGDAGRLLDEGGRELSAEADSQLLVWAFDSPGASPATRGPAPRG